MIRESHARAGRGVRMLLVMAVVFFAHTVAGQAAVLLGTQTLRTSSDSDPAGVAEAFQTTATATGSATTLSVYVDAGTTATTVSAGIYSDVAGHPGSLLTQGSTVTPVRAAWNTISVPAAPLTSGTTYWIALLGTGGIVTFRDGCCGAGTPSETHANRTLTTLPTSWSTGKTYRDGPLSAYASAPDGPVLGVTPTTLNFTGVPGGANPAPQQVTVSNNGGGTVNWSVSSDSSWLSATPGIGTATAGAPGAVSVSVSTSTLSAGTYTGTITVSDPASQGSPKQVVVKLVLAAPDTTPPEVSITAPTNGATVSGTTAVSASAFDNVAVAGVQFQVDGANIGNEVTSNPYSDQWDTTTVSNGSHTLTAVARDTSGNTATSSPVAITVANTPQPPTALLGTQTILSGADSNPPGVAEAFQTTASSSGTASKLSVYVDSGNTASVLMAGLYSDNNGHPGSLLGQGSLNAPISSAWNDVPLSGGAITSGTKYWIAVLAPTGTLRYRDGCCGSGTAAESASNRSLQSLPASWTTGKTYRDGPISAYASSGSTTPQPPQLMVSPSTLTFSALTNGTPPSPSSVNVSNLGSGNLPFTDQSDSTWLTVTPTSGTAPQPLTVSVNQSGLTAGTYTGHITVDGGSIQGSPATVVVTLNVSDPPPPPPPGSSHDWPMVDHDPMRSGNSSAETTLSPQTAPNLAQLWQTPVDGKVTAQPLYLAGVTVNGQQHDVVIAATAQNSIYALDANTGAQLWRRNFGVPGSNCGIAGGFGISGAPVVDRANDRIYTISDDGQLRSITLSTGADAAPAVPVIDRPSTNKVWGGLNLVGTTLYVPTASDGCDSPPWRGRVYKIDVSTSTPTVSKTWVVVPSIADPNGGGGIWGYGGVSIDTATNTVFASPGADSNEAYAPYADRLVALDSNLNVLGSYAPPHPTSFPCAGAPCDVDFGATPVVFQPSGCPTLVAAGNKDGHLYVERENDLTASLAPLQILTLNHADDGLGNGGVGGVPAYWPEGRMLFVTDAGGNTGVAGLSAGVVGLTVNSDCTLSVAWSQPLGGNSYPNSTPTVANGVVYVGEGNGGLVHAYDARSGTELWNGGGSTGGSTFAAPSIGDGKLFAGSWNGGGSTDGGTIRAFAPSSSPSAVTLLGTTGLETTLDSNPTGKAEAFQATATTSGTLASLWLYLDASSTATKLVLGVYADGGNGHPGALLTQGSSTTLVPGTFNKISVPTVSIAAGTPYWLALLAPSSGTIQFRDRSHGPCRSESSAQTTLTSLPGAWTTGTTYTDCPVSGYGSTGS